MFRFIFLVSMGVLCLSVNTFAQKVNTDSLKLISKISEDQLKLGKLQNTVEQKTRDKQDNALAAQQSADKNSTAANRLSSDPENKKDAKNADNAASDARSSAKSARKANDRLEKVNKDIADLQSKIASEQAQLNNYTRMSNVPAVAAQPVQQDSTQRP